MPDHDQPSSWGPTSYSADSYAPGPYGQAYHPQPQTAPPAVATQPYGPAGYFAQAPVQVAMVPPRADGRGLAIAGVVLGGLAVIGVLVVLALVLTGVAGGGSDEDSGSYPPVRGALAPSATGGLTGAALAGEVSQKVRDQGGTPEGITCPDTARVAQDVTTVCHGNVNGAEYAFVVFFEDARGDYTILEL